jgi:glycosyltransferase involved in cell wall biosynthesis
VKKNIIFFIPSIESGGVEKNFYLLTKLISKNEKNFYVISADKPTIKLKNVRYIYVKNKFLLSKGRFYKTILCIILLIKNFAFKKNVILSFQSNILLLIFSKIFFFKTIIRLNTSLKKYIDSRFKLFFFKFIYSFADKIIVNSYQFRKELTKINLKSKVIYNLINLDKAKFELNFFKNFKYLKILNIGRLTSQKNQIILIKSLSLLKKKKINFRCSIVGRGKFKEKLKRCIRKYDLEKNVRLIGYKKNAENYMKNADVFVLTSLYEGLPNVLIEAQKNYIPIISSNCPTGPKEILLNGKLGELFQVDDYKKLSNLLFRFNNNKKSLLKKRDLAIKYLNRFDLNLNSKKYLDLIKAL